MINLIPPIGQTALKHEYILKVFTCYALLLSGVFIAGGVMRIPSYALVQSQLTTELSQAEEVQSTQAEFRVIQQELEDARSLALFLNSGIATQTVSSLISGIVDTATPGIAFKTFQIVPEGGSITSVSVFGVASNRTELAAFKNSLEALPEIETATIPLADLAKEEDLPFALTITLRAIEEKK